MSDAKKEIVTQLHIIQAEIGVPKDRENKFAKYSYRNAEDILGAVKKLLPLGCSVTLSDDIKLIGERYYIEATASFFYKDECISVKAYAREPLIKKGNDESQITGSTSSYARKYALNGLFAIDDGTDADAEDNREPAKQERSHPPTQHKQRAPQEQNNEMTPIGAEKAANLRHLIKKVGSEENSVKAYSEQLLGGSFAALEDMPIYVYYQIMPLLNKKLEAISCQEH